jgi:hypothetical protein
MALTLVSNPVPDRYSYPLVSHYPVLMNTNDSHSLLLHACCCTHMLHRSSPQDSLFAGRSLYRCEKITSLSPERLLYRREKIHRYPFLTHCISLPRFHRHPLLARCVSVRRLPVGRLPVYLLILAYITSRFSIFLDYSRKRCPPLYLLWFSVCLTRTHWRSGRSVVRGFPGCLLLGAAASLSVFRCKRSVIQPDSKRWTQFRTSFVVWAKSLCQL